MKFLISFAALLFSLSVSAQNAESLLARDILASQKTLTHPVRLYNYFQVAELWPGLHTPAGRLAFTQNHLSARAGQFWDDQFNNDSKTAYASGPGLYLAIDPYISTGYGNSYVEMTVPAGTKFINVVREVPVNRATIEALVSEGFITRNQTSELFARGFFRDTLRVMVLPQYQNFRRLVQEIFRKNSIQFVEYNFNTSLAGFCRRHSYSAFLYVGLPNATTSNRAIIDPAFTSVMLHSDAHQMNALSANEVQQKNRITKFKNFLYEISEILKQKRTLTRDFMLSRYTDAEMNELRQFTYSCEN